MLRKVDNFCYFYTGLTLIIYRNKLKSFSFHIIDNKSDKKLSDLDCYVKSHPHGSVFQHPDMFRFYDDVKGYQPYYFVVYENGNIAASFLVFEISEISGIKKQLTSRIISFGAPLISQGKDNHEILSFQIIKELEKFVGKRPLYIQFRLFESASWRTRVHQPEADKFHPPLGAKSCSPFDTPLLCGGVVHKEERPGNCFEKAGYFSQRRYNSLIRIDNKENCFRRLSESKRRQIKKSLNKGAKITEIRNKEQLQDYYQILKNLFKTKVKKPLPEYSFFESFYEFSLENKLGKILLVELERKIIGGIVCLITPGKAIYEWYICGLDKEYQKMGVYPSVMATWGTIEYACKNNIPVFDMMGAGKPGVPYGVREFKQKFGSEKIIQYRFNKIINKPKYELAEFVYNIKRWLF